MEKKKGSWGWRVFRIHVDKTNRKRLKEIFNDVIDGHARTKGTLLYREAWISEWQNVLKMVKEAGKRTMPNPPAVYLPLRFKMPDGTIRGNKSSPCVIDLSKCELNIPSYDVKVPLRKSVCRELIEENCIEARPDFVVQITRKGFLRLIAKRENIGRKQDMEQQRTLLICFDENTSHGLFTTLVSFDGENIKVARGPTFKPPNATFLRRVSAKLQSIAGKKTTDQILGLWLTPERARDFYRKYLSKEKRLNQEWKRRVVAWIRKTFRDAIKENRKVVILIDEVTYFTAHNGRIRRVSKLLRNLSLYEGAQFLSLRASGKFCPKCGSKGVEVAKRIFRCQKCGLEWNRDRMATFALALAYAKITKNEALRKALLRWLEEHPKALLS
jgi:ribosomal protein L37AE/L43A